MNTIEQRLIDALNARADLVTPESLTPSAPPAPVVPLRSRFPRPAGYAVAAAAVAAAVAAPFVIPALTGDDAGKKGDVPPVVEIGVDWPVTHRASFDVDGDGRPDEILLKNDPESSDSARVDVELASGGTPGVVVPTRGVPVLLGTPAGADGQAGLDVTVAGEHGELVALLVFREGDLLPVTGIDPVAFAFEPDAENHTHHWWVFEDGLYTATSVQAFQGQLPVTYAVDLLRWRVTDDLALRPRGEAVRLCTDKEDPTGFPDTCDRTDAGPDTTADDGFDDGASPFLDVADEFVLPVTTVTFDMGSLGNVSGRIQGSGEGNQLILAAPSGTEWRAWLTQPEGVTAQPGLSTTLVDAGPGEPGMVLVRWGGPGGSSQIYRIGDSDGELTLMPYTDSLGQGTTEDGSSARTVLTTGGTLYSLVQVDAVEIQVYRWRAEGTAYMVLDNEGRSIGSWCKNEVDPDQPPYVEC